MPKAIVWIICCFALVVGIKNVKAEESPSRVKAMFKKLDIDNDKRVSLDEYLGKRSDKNGKYRKQFQNADLDNDRKLSVHEYKKLLSSER